MTDLAITGMTCSHCQKAVKDALESVAGVESATVNLTAGTASIRGNADLSALVAAIEEEGYGATPARH